MTGTRSEGAWSDFWQAGGAGPESGCLPRALRGIDAAQRRVWQDAVRPLRRRARVLDLATGDGAVLGKILSLRSDLDLVGVDSAATLPRGPKGAALRAKVPMEKLPFGDNAFDLVTSQFGFEYGDTAAAGREVARVLREDGRFHFLIHHAEGPIVAHNQSRCGSLQWAVMESGLLQKARALVKARSTTDLPTPPSFQAAPAEARRLFADQGVSAEFAMAIFQTLEMGRRAPLSESLEVLQALEDKVCNEMERIEALRAAARDASQIAQLAEELRSVGLEVERPIPVHETGREKPFAWHLHGRGGGGSRH